MSRFWELTEQSWAIFYQLLVEFWWLYVGFMALFVLVLFLIYRPWEKDK